MGHFLQTNTRRMDGSRDHREVEDNTSVHDRAGGDGGFDPAGQKGFSPRCHNGEILGPPNVPPHGLKERQGDQDPQHR